MTKRLLLTYEKIVCYNGNVIADVAVGGNGTVEINADVTGQESVALEVSGEAEVTVNGDVAGRDATEDRDWSTEGLYAYDSAKVTVNGDVTGGSGVETEEVMEDPQGWSDGSNAVGAYGEAEVSITGDVAGGDAYGTYGYAGVGITAYDEAQVTVGGDVTGGDVIADPEVEVHTETWEDENGETYSDTFNSIAGTAIVAESTATVTVGGDVTGGSTNGDAGEGGNGIYLEMSHASYDEEGNVVQPEVGAITVDGTVTGGAGGENGQDAAAVYFETYMSGENLDLEAALEADSAEMLEEYLEAVENEDEEALQNSKYMALEMAMWLMQENGDLTEEELEAFYEQFADNNELTEELMLEIMTAAQKLIKENASSDNLLGLMAYGFADLTLGDVSDANGGAFDSNMGAEDAEQYADDNVVVLSAKGGSNNGNPATGDNSGIMVIAAVMVVSMLGICALVVQRKRAV